MSKAYIMVRTDLADTAAVDAAVAANPGAFSLGTLILSADGALHYVNAAGTVLAITAA